METTAATVSETTTKKLAALKQLCDVTGENLFERLKLADEVLSDREWVNISFISEAAARDHLAERYFPDIFGLVTTGELFQLIKAFPLKSNWEEHKYHVKAMLATIKDDSRQGRRKTEEPTKSELREKVSELELELANVRLALAERTRRAGKAEAKIHELVRNAAA